MNIASVFPLAKCNYTQSGIDLVVHAMLTLCNLLWKNALKGSYKVDLWVFVLVKYAKAKVIYTLSKVSID